MKTNSATTTVRPVLASIRYQHGSGNIVDALLDQVAAQLVGAKQKIAGAIKHTTQRPDRCRCDMTLHDLYTGKFVPISQDRGPEARGCSLDSYALEDVVGSTMAGLHSGAGFLIINRFGKQEAGGNGFRPAIEFAASHHVPCLVGVGSDNLMAWETFTDGFDEHLAHKFNAVWNWCVQALPACASAPNMGLKSGQPPLHSQFSP